MGVNLGAVAGVVVAGELSAELVGMVAEHHVEPVALRFRARDGKGKDFEVPVRDLTVQEVVMVVNRAMESGRLEFGFRERSGGNVNIVTGM